MHVCVFSNQFTPFVLAQKIFLVQDDSAARRLRTMLGAADRGTWKPVAACLCRDHLSFPKQVFRFGRPVGLPPLIYRLGPGAADDPQDGPGKRGRQPGRSSAQRRQKPLISCGNQRTARTMARHTTEDTPAADWLRPTRCKSPDSRCESVALCACILPSHRGPPCNGGLSSRRLAPLRYRLTHTVPVARGFYIPFILPHPWALPSRCGVRLHHAINAAVSNFLRAGPGGREQGFCRRKLLRQKGPWPFLFKHPNSDLLEV